MKYKKAFTLIELLVVIAIIGILATISVLALNNARAKSRDAKRAGDMKQIQTALELFFNDKQRYPTVEEWATGQVYSTSTNSTSTYMKIIPSAPTPNDGTCTMDQNAIFYQPTDNWGSYSISFCLGNTTGSLTPGPKCLTPSGIADVDCSSACPLGIIYGGESYPTVSIGDQCWLAKNLNIGNYIGSGSAVDGYDGDPGTNDDCFDVNSPTGWWSCQGYGGVQKYCYDNDENNCVADGGLYEWAEALGLPSDCNNSTSTDNGNGTYGLECPDSGPQTILAKQQGICPSGWHIPSDSDLGTNSDWRTLEQGLATDPNCDSFADGCFPAGDRIKKVDDCFIAGDPSCGSSGFEASLSGYRSIGGSFIDRGTIGFIWSNYPDLNSPLNAWPRGFVNNSSGFWRSDAIQAGGLSVRCIKN